MWSDFTSYPILPLQTADDKDSNGENNDSDEEDEDAVDEAAWPLRPTTSSEVTEDSRGSRDDGLPAENHAD